MNRADDCPTGAKFGPLRFCAFRKDGSPMMSSAFVVAPIATECYFWMWSIMDGGANDDYFFGPTVAA